MQWFAAFAVVVVMSIPCTIFAQETQMSQDPNLSKAASMTCRDYLEIARAIHARYDEQIVMVTNERDEHLSVLRHFSGSVRAASAMHGAECVLHSRWRDAAIADPSTKKSEIRAQWMACVEQSTRVRNVQISDAVSEYRNNEFLARRVVWAAWFARVSLRQAQCVVELEALRRDYQIQHYIRTSTKPRSRS